MPEKRVTLTRTDIRQRLAKLDEHISRANFDRLEKILPLFRLAENTKANLAECLDVVSPKKKGDRQKQQADFRLFRQHVAAAFREAGLGIELTVDTRKRTDASERECWFTGPPIDCTTERIAQFSQDAADTIGPPAVEPVGVDSRRLDRRVVHCCILAAPADRRLAAKLAERLRSEFEAQSEFVYDVWDLDSAVAGENEPECRLESLRNADVLLLFASPAFLADQSLKSSMMETSAETIPVLLRPISQKHDQSCFGGRKLFDLDLPRGGSRSFDECSGQQRSQFAQELFELVHDRCRRVPPAEKVSAPRHRSSMGNEAARGLTELFMANDPDDPIEPRGRRAQFGEDVTKRVGEADTAGAVPMFQALDDWIKDPKAAVYAAVLGESGIGKTTLLKTKTLQWIDARRTDSSLPLPIYIDLRLFMPTIQEQQRVPGNLVEMLDEVLGRAAHRGDISGVSGEDIVPLVQQDGAILIFDGLDEKLVHLDENQGMALMRVLWEALPHAVVRKQRKENAVGHGRLVFSCRSHYFKSLREQNALFLGEDREGLRSDDYCAWVLLPFNEQQVREYLGREIGSDRVDAAIELFL